MKNNVKGITLVSMVITIIVMLILAGVSISMVVGENGVLTRASTSAVKTNLASVAEDFNLAVSDIEMQYETAWSDASSISAYKGLFVTVEKLNNVLSQSKVLTTEADDFITPLFSIKSSDKCTVANIPAITNTCKVAEYPVSQLTGESDLSKLKTPSAGKEYFIMYLSNGENGDTIGTDVFAAVCKVESGIPLLIDLGLVESDINSTALKNGALTVTNGVITAGNGTGAGTLPPTVTWLHNAMGLNNTVDGVNQ